MHLFEEKLVRVLDLNDHVLRGNVISVARVLCSSLGKDDIDIGKERQG